MENDKRIGKEIAVIGGGVAGIVAAYLLQRKHRVTLFEKGDYLGGHTHTIEIPDGPDAGTPVDTGFIVFNEATYPLFISFLKELGVSSRTTEMSFGFHCRQTGFTYAGSTVNGLFAQRSNLFSPRFYRFLGEIVRFCRQAQADLVSGQDLGTLADYLRIRNFHPFMVDNYLKPMAAAIWSTPTAQVTGFPAQAFLGFFRNHGLLSLFNRPRWRTVSGGSSAYVKAFAEKFNGTVRLNCPIDKVVRDEEGVALQLEGQSWHRFDQVVFATHADQTLRLLAEPTADERRLLSTWRYERNHVVLHTEEGVLPPNRRAWACWNFVREQATRGESKVYVTYAMNILQGLNARNQYLVTLNRPSSYGSSEVIAEMVYDHPLYTDESMASQKELPSLNKESSYFCGSYFGYGFHEDAVRSSFAAVDAMEQPK